MSVQPTRRCASKAIWAVLLGFILAACATVGPNASTTADQSPNTSAVATSSLPPAVAGEPCSTRAEVRNGLSCIRSRSGLRWQARYTYKEQTCNPDDPTIRSNRIELPAKELPESRVAAACVALEWLANASNDYPKLKVVSKLKIKSSVLAALNDQARGSLRLIWKYRGLEEIDPGLIVITSPAEHCALARELLVPNEADRVVQENDCKETRQFSCESLQTSGFAVMWNARNSIDQRLAGFKVSGCADQNLLGVSFHKFWQGVGASLTLDLQESTAFATALVNPDYLISEYPYILWTASQDGSVANMCGAEAKYYVCQDWFRGSLDTYVSSREWWKGQEPEHELSIWSQQYNYARQAAMEWFIAHFGLDAAFGLGQALVGVSSETEYLAVLDSYTDWTHEQIFAGVDAWVAPKFGIAAP